PLLLDQWLRAYLAALALAVHDSLQPVAHRDRVNRRNVRLVGDAVPGAARIDASARRLRGVVAAGGATRNKRGALPLNPRRPTSLQPTEETLMRRSLLSAAAVAVMLSGSVY